MECQKSEFSLRNQNYFGLREVNVKYRNEDQSTLKSFQKYSIVKASWPAIVDTDLFNEVQRCLGEATNLERDRLSKSVVNAYWLSGIIRCPDCGKKYVGACAHGRHEVHRYYIHLGKSDGKCRYRRIRAEEIEEKIETHLGEILEINGHFDEIQQNIEKCNEEKSADIIAEKAGLEKRASQLSIDLERLFELQLNSEGVAQELFKERLAKIGSERKTIENRLLELTEQIEKRNSLRSESRRIRSRVEEFRKGWKRATAAEKKRLGRRVLSKLIPSERGLEIFYFTDRSEDEMKSGKEENKAKVAGANTSLTLAQKTKDQCREPLVRKKIWMG